MTTKRATATARKGRKSTKPNKASAAATASAKAAPPSVPSCLCGCGAATSSAKKRFRMGHDARLKGVLQRAFRGEGLSAKQQEIVTMLGWERFMTPDPRAKAKGGVA